MKKDQLLQMVQDICESAAGQDCEETRKAIVELTEEEYGTVPFVLRMLSRRPDICIPSMMKSFSLFKGKKILDAKTSELIAISSAVANRCEFCINVHMDKALSAGATMEEIFHAILIASAICESSARAVAFREFRRLEGKQRHRGPEKGRA